MWRADRLGVPTAPDLLETLSERATLHLSAKSGPEAILPVLTVDDGKRFQEIDGFGASLTDSAAWLFAKKLPPAQMDTAFKMPFSRKSGIGLSILRQPVGSSDLAVTFYSLDDLCQQAAKACTTPKGWPRCPVFGLELHTAVQLCRGWRPGLRAINRGMAALLTPWSPPGWMEPDDARIKPGDEREVEPVA